MKALIIEDNMDVQEAISLCFQLRWPNVDIISAITGNAGVDFAKSDSFDVVILDINLPDISGFKVLERIRSFSNVPVLIVTIRGEEDDQARGLEMGADDYIQKPFRPRDLVARVNSVLRRTQSSQDFTTEPSVVRGKLTLNLVNDEAYFGEQALKLTPNECKILYILMTNEGETLNIDRLVEGLGGKDKNNAELARTYIRRIRDKLKDKPPQIILNQRGGGYRFVSPV